MQFPTKIASLKPYLFKIAYQMTGSVEESEDILQDVLFQWLQKDQKEIDSQKKYLAKAVINRSLNYAEKLKKVRATYKGVSLPEPIVEGMLDFELDSQNDLKISFLLLLEQLNPIERAIFILRESFDMNFADIGFIVDKPEDGCRQMHHRSLKKVKSPKKRFSAKKEQVNTLIQAYQKACFQGELNDFIDLLKEDIQMFADGGGKVPSALKPLIGKPIVSLFLTNLQKKFGHLFHFEFVNINGGPGVISYRKVDNLPDSVISFEQDEDGVCQIYSQRNPDKLKFLQKNRPFCHE